MRWHYPPHICSHISFCTCKFSFNYMQVYTETGYIYPEALKLLMLLTDLMNGFIYEIGNLAQHNPRTVGHVAFILPGTIYTLLGLSYIILYLILFSRGPSIVRALKCVMGIPPISGTWLVTIIP